jgi:hypothetical protein
VGVFSEKRLRETRRARGTAGNALRTSTGGGSARRTSTGWLEGVGTDRLSGGAVEVEGPLLCDTSLI